MRIYASCFVIVERGRPRPWPLHPSDVILDPIRRPCEYQQVLEKWLARQQSWADARRRFLDTFSRQYEYSVDRLIAAANMFEILPPHAVPEVAELPDLLKSARDNTAKLFRGLEPSPERDSVLNVLGRVGKATLKQKIRYRAQIVSNSAGDRFPDLALVTDEAVNCRNYFVHGGTPKFDYQLHSMMQFFFIRTLEFVFAASDLIECGWDFRAWISNGSRQSHPIGELIIAYRERLEELKRIISASS